MSEVANPVFTEQEVVSLNDYQGSGGMHPFTCGSGHRTEHADGEGVLVATTRGWICPFCDYTQNWAHDWMKNGDWRKAGTYQVIDLLRERSRLVEQFHGDLAQALVALVERYEHLESAINRAIARQRFPVTPIPKSRVLAKAHELMDKMKAQGMLPEVEHEEGTEETKQGN